MLTKLATVVWKSRRPLFFFASLLFLLFSCATTPQNQALLPYHSQESHVRQGVDFFPSSSPNESFPPHWNWENIVDGINYTSFDSKNTPLRWHMVSVDLHNPQITPVAYPTWEDVDSKGIFTGKTTRQFLEKTSSLVALNASPFETPLSYLFPQRKIMGLFINQGKLISPAIPRYSAICLAKTNGQWIPKIISNQAEYPPETELALGGFFTILKDGEVQDFPSFSLDSRTAIGITKDERYLIILYIEGNNKKLSTGLSYEESALVMKAAGAWNALQMDGGSSSGLSVVHKDIMDKFTLPVANILGFTTTFQ